MNSRKTFGSRPPSRSSKPEFYWRGGDALKEKEYLYDQYQKALADLDEKDIELRQLQEEVETTRLSLNETEGYTTALASWLDGDVESANEENELKRQLAELEAQQSEAQKELDYWVAYQNPAAASNLQKEKAYYLLEIQKGTKELEDFHDSYYNTNNRLTDITLSQRFFRSWENDLKCEKAVKKRNYLRSLVVKTKNDFDGINPPRNPANDEGSREERQVLNSGIDKKISLEIAKEKIQRHKAKHRFELEYIIGFIEEINERMREQESEEYIIDTEELRSKYLKEEDDENVEEMDTKPSKLYGSPMHSPSQSPTRSAPQSRGSPTNRGKVYKPAKTASKPGPISRTTVGARLAREKESKPETPKIGSPKQIPKTKETAKQEAEGGN